MQLACRLLFVDLEGLNDGRATKTIIPKVAPRKLVSPAECVGDPRHILNVFSAKIIVHGGPASTDSLLESYANIRNMTKDIYSPAEGESVQIGQNTNSYSISLSDEMLASVRMSRVGPDRREGCITTHLFTFDFSSKTTRLASSRGGSPQLRARTCQCSNRSIKPLSPQAALPWLSHTCWAQDQRNACPIRR